MSAPVGRLIQTPFGQVSVTCTVEQAREIERQADAGDPGMLFALRVRGVWALGSNGGHAGPCQRCPIEPCASSPRALCLRVATREVPS